MPGVKTILDINDIPPTSSDEDNPYIVIN